MESQDLFGTWHNQERVYWLVEGPLCLVIMTKSISQCTVRNVWRPINNERRGTSRVPSWVGCMNFFFFSAPTILVEKTPTRPFTCFDLFCKFMNAQKMTYHIRCPNEYEECDECDMRLRAQCGCVHGHVPRLVYRSLTRLYTRSLVRPQEEPGFEILLALWKAINRLLEHNSMSYHHTQHERSYANRTKRVRMPLSIHMPHGMAQQWWSWSKSSRAVTHALTRLTCCSRCRALCPHAHATSQHRCMSSCLLPTLIGVFCDGGGEAYKKSQKFWYRLQKNHLDIAPRGRASST